MHVTRLEEDVGLVEQEDGTPCMADVQDLLELSLKETGIGA